MHLPTTDVLLVIFVAIAAIALLVQMLVFLGMARQLKALTEEIAPLVPLVGDAAKAVPGVLREAQALIAETRPKLQAATANLVEISALARVQAQRVDTLVGDFSERVQLQLVRVDEALAASLATVEEIATTVRHVVLKPVNDFHAVFQGVRTGLDFFFRRRSSPPASQRASVYQDDEMFI